MTAFVILAAGPGTRMGRAGDALHKALVPLDGRALISHQIALAPEGARIIVCCGYRSTQMQNYLALAHPGCLITWVPVLYWDRPGAGPGATLLLARDIVGDDDMIFTSCDTIWAADETLWKTPGSWAAVAPIPAGTPPERWCRIASAGGQAQAIYDKTPSVEPGDAYTGLAMIQKTDLPAFWEGVETAVLLGGERQVTGGLQALIPGLQTRRIAWTDIGDEAAYQRAVAAWSGYDWTKTGEVTYVLPETQRVVKFRDDEPSLRRRIDRQASIAAATPELTGTRSDMFAYKYVPGVTGYQAAEYDPDLVHRLLAWAWQDLWRPVHAADPQSACGRFYLGKTGDRIAMLRPGLREIARHAAARVNWAELTTGYIPVTFHGDFNLGNIIATGRDFTAIDWREDFAGETSWGDQRYDLAKLVAGMIVHWGNARRGDFRPWDQADFHLAAIADCLGGHIPHDIMVIAALSLISSAPLHAPPLDEVAVARAAALLEEL